MAISPLTLFKVNLSDEVVNSMEGMVRNKNHVPENIQHIMLERTASLEEIKLIKTYFQGDGLKVHELLSTSEIVLPEPIVEPRNPELEARIQKLKRMVEQHKYDEMTKNIRAKGRDPDDSIGAQLQFMNKQLIAVAQFVLSVGSGFAFGFYGVQLMVGELDFGFRLLLGVICSLVIALAEIYFLAKIIAELDLEGTVKTEEENSPKRKTSFVEEPPDPNPPHQQPVNEKLHQD